MLAMQYSIALPATYDMSLIRARVEERSKLFETLPGLFHKSYLANEREKIYAPFYLWSNITEARRFMLNDLFRGVIQAFSRPRVRMWTVVEHAYGNKKLHPTYAVRETDSIPPEENLEHMVEKELKAQGELLKNENLHFHAIALDPDRWELMRYSLWKDETSATIQAADVVQRYTVLQVSEPDGNSVSSLKDI